METNKIQNIALAQIVSSSVNPRKTFNEKELLELTNNIKEIGLIQPITVRPKGKKFEIVCGERRYKAFVLAEKETIPAVIYNLTDDEAENFAIVENLQREDISPLEEAESFRRLAEKRKEDIASIALKVGKSEVFVRGRLTLTQLVDSFKELLSKNEIDLRTATLFASYNNEIQNLIFEERFSENVSSWNSWSNIKFKQIANGLKSNYNFNLSKAIFDTTECEKCPYNSIANTLFENEVNENAQCRNTPCFQLKNDAEQTRKLDTVFEENKGLEVIGRYNDSFVKDYIEQNSISMAEQTPDYTVEEEPSKPNKEKFTLDGVLDKKKYQEELKEYREELKEYQEGKIEIEERLKVGELEAVIAIVHGTAKLAYREVSTEIADTPDAEIAKLKAQDERYKEIQIEKTVEEIKKDVITDASVLVNTEILLNEEKMFYFFLFDYLPRDKALELVNADEKCYYATHPQIWERVQNLSQEDKNLLMRNFIAHKVRKGAYGKGDVCSELLIDFAKLHFQKETEEIETKNEKVYLKREENIKLKIERLTK